MSARDPCEGHRAVNECLTQVACDVSASSVLSNASVPGIRDGKKVRTVVAGRVKILGFTSIVKTWKYSA